MPNVPMNISKVLAEQSANAQLTQKTQYEHHVSKCPIWVLFGQS